MSTEKEKKYWSRLKGKVTKLNVGGGVIKPKAGVTYFERPPEAVPELNLEQLKKLADGK